CYDGTNFVRYTQKDGLAHENVCAVTSGQDGVLWFGTGSGSLSRFDGKSFVNLVDRDRGANLRALHITSDGAVWCATGNGLWRYDPDSIISFAPEDGLTGNNIGALKRGDRSLWIVAGSGLLRYDGHAFVDMARSPGLPQADFRNLERAADG